MADMIKFFKGLEASLPASGVNGALYITTDEGGIYLGTGTGMKRLGDFVQVNNVASLPAKAHESCLYYCVAENILAKWNGSEWKQINKQPTAEELKTLLGLGALAYKSEVAEGDLNADLKAKVNAAAEGNHSHDNKALLDTYTQTEANLADAVAKKHSHSFSDEAALNGITAAKVADWDDAVSKEHTHTFADSDVEDAIAKKHSHTFNETELNKIAAGDVAKWNGVVADHLVAADKTELADSIGDVNTALETYKTSNNEALAGVKATADAAATKEYTDAELAKKVTKTDYEADKATFATKTELGDVDAKFANYKTAADQKLIDDAQDVEIGKKVEKVTGKSLVDDAEITKLAGVSEGANKVEASTNGKIKIDGVDTTVYVHPDKHTVSEISDFETKIASYDYATKTEAQGYADAKDEAIEAAQKTADDLATYVGTFTASEGVDTVVKYIDAKTANIASDERVNAIDNRVKAIEDDYLVEADIANFETKENVNKVADDLAAYVESNDEALAGVKATAEAARTEDEVNSQIDAKITALNLGATYEPIGAETRAKAYADGLISDANLAQYTTEQEVKDIVDGVIAGAVDGDTITGLANLVEYINTHGGEAAEMGAAIDVLEGKVETIEGKPAYGITATQISNWDGEVGAKALAETKLDASTFTEYSNAHAGDYTNKQIDDAIDADVKTAIDAEVLRANGAYDAKGAAADARAAAIADAATKYETIGTAQGIVDALKLGETYEPIGAETRAIAAAEGKVNALAGNVYTKDQTYTQAEVDALLSAATSWGEF